VRGSEFGGENPEHLEKLDAKYYRPFGARLARAPKGREGYQGRAERSHRTDDEEFFIPCVARAKSTEQFLNMAQRWQYYYDARWPHFGMGMEGSTPMEKLRELGLDLPDEFACFPVVLLDEVAMVWAVERGHDLLAYYNSPDSNDTHMIRFNTHSPLPPPTLGT